MIKRNIFRDNTVKKFLRKYKRLFRKDNKLVNTLVLNTYECNDDKCTEPSKKLIGWGTRYVTKDEIMQGVSKHVNFYTCENSENCNKRCSLNIAQYATR